MQHMRAWTCWLFFIFSLHSVYFKEWKMNFLKNCIIVIKAVIAILTLAKRLLDLFNWQRANLFWNFFELFSGSGGICNAYTQGQIDDLFHVPHTEVVHDVFFNGESQRRTIVDISFIDSVKDIDIQTWLFIAVYISREFRAWLDRRWHDQLFIKSTASQRSAAKRPPNSGGLIVQHL